MGIRILVTGGCGFVGRHLVHRLGQDPENLITVVDDLSTGRPLEEWPDHLKTKVAEIVYGDCCAYFESARNESFDLVFHLAAVVEGRATIEGQPMKVARDLTIDATMFNWAVEARPAKVAYFSSSAAYPINLQTESNHVALKEDMISFSGDSIGIPDLSYGWAKLSGEFLANLAARSDGLDVAVYRPFSGYGEDQSLSYPFPSIIKRVTEFSGGSLDVWGSGKQSRDFIYIEDCITSILDSVESLTIDEPLNLGTGQRTTFEDLIRLACEVAGKPQPEITPIPGTPEGVFARFCDPSEQLERGLAPAVSLEEGIRITLEHQSRGLS